MRRKVPAFLTALLLLGSGPIHLRAQDEPVQVRPAAEPFNLGVVYPDLLLRSAAPSEEFLARLQHAYGLRTIVDLRDPIRPKEGPLIRLERRWAESLGLRYVLRTLSPENAPEAALETVSWLRDLLRDPQATPILVHCQHGRDRTGFVVAVLRHGEGWSYEKALEEMKSFGHQPERYRKLQEALQRLFAETAGY